MGLDADLEHELTIDMSGNAVVTDPVAVKIAEHRSAIDQASRAIMTIERQRDLAVRGFESQLEQAEFVYANALAHFSREIEKAKTTAETQISVQRQLLLSSEAALRPLDPFVAPKGDDPSKRRVPRVVTGI
ncbi:MAG: hypothetical protein IKE42_15330 [Aquamicrobium sp.]|nr:hypothetical protein [Aquamicrobium sp.]